MILAAGTCRPSILDPSSGGHPRLDTSRGDDLHIGADIARPQTVEPTSLRQGHGPERPHGWFPGTQEHRGHVGVDLIDEVGCQECRGEGRTTFQQHPVDAPVVQCREHRRGVGSP